MGTGRQDRGTRGTSARQPAARRAPSRTARPKAATARAAAAAAKPLKGFQMSTLDPDATIAGNVGAMVALGASIIRFPLYFDHEPKLAVWLRRIDVARAAIGSRRVALVIDVHHHPALAKVPTAADETDLVTKWSQIARHCVAASNVWYDLGNEPVNLRWRALALRAATEIRKWDKANRIVFPARGTTTSEAPDVQALPGIGNQAIEFHFYNWTDVQVDGRPYPSARRTKADLVRLLTEVRDAGTRNKVPVYIGEVAIVRAHANAPRFLRDFTSTCTALGIHLTVHAYREFDGWDYEKNPPAWSQLTTWLAAP